jgi:hypothetical protein
MEKGEGKKQQQKNLPVRGDTDEEEVPSLLAIIIRSTSELFTPKLFDECLRILSLKEEEKEYHPTCLPTCLPACKVLETKPSCKLKSLLLLRKRS